MSNLSETEQLLSWYHGHLRDLPWRDAPCGKRTPYRVWLAEIMLQQTTVSAVIPYYLKFLKQWPDVRALAAAPDDDVMYAWAGLGYYARARNMVKCARYVTECCQGVFPVAESDLLKLPGIGSYTAAAVAAFVSNAPTVPVDGNVIRTISRLYAVEAEMPKHKNIIKDLAERLFPVGQSGDFAEALMDLGSQICRPRNPDCPACPWHLTCKAYGSANVTDFPKKAFKKEKPTRRGWAFWIVRKDGSVLLERRPEKGLLGGMMGLPTTQWAVKAPSLEGAMQPFDGYVWKPLPGKIKHTFTHFHLELGVVRVDVDEDAAIPGVWVAQKNLEEQALPSAMKKAIAHAQAIDPKRLLLGSQ